MQEKRQYVRMKTVFPVEFTVAGDQREERTKHLLQGFTRDVSAVGICIELKSFGKQTEKELSNAKAALSLCINPPFSFEPIMASGQIVWLRKVESVSPPRYYIGVAYTQIDARSRRRIVGYAHRLIWLPRIFVALSLASLLTVTGLFLHERQINLDNKKIVNLLIQNAERKSEIASKLVEIQNAKIRLTSALDLARQKIKDLQSQAASLQTQSAGQRDVYEKDLKSNLEKQKDLSERLKSVESGQARLETDFGDIQRSGRMVASAGLRQMYEWIKSHRNVKTGLVASYEGDPSLENVAFTYDLSLVCQTFLIFGDTASARSILSFYDTKAGKQDGAFVNAYDTLNGEPVESLVHVGPNIWIGIAALQYEHRTKEGQFIGMAKRIGDWLISLQDSEGGLKGGPAFSWYSTEHNLDAYAYFRMLYEITGDKKYKNAQDKVFAWIRKYAYSMAEGRMNRGKGDATIATDTFSWAVAAIGPETLKKYDFDPEAIMEFAEEHCKVKVSYKQPGGKTATAYGFDFAKAQNVGRGGIISCEWTAQVVVTYQILSAHFASIGNAEKARFYKDKANFYLSELQKLIIASPSKIGKGRGCLPYASADNVDTGHGWRTPKGVRTGSLSSTAYSIFAWVGFNPFDLKNDIQIEKNQDA